MTALFETREEWLQAASVELRSVMLAETGLTIPNVRVGVGFTSGGLRTNELGQTWARKASKDGINEITVRVTVNDPVDVLAVLGHELIHAALDCKGAHGKTFTRAHLAMGYVSDSKGCVLGAELREAYAALTEALGDYPGDDGLAVAAMKKKQTTRMRKCTCVTCGFTFRTTARWIADRALECPDVECEGAVHVSTDEGSE